MKIIEEKTLNLRFSTLRLTTFLCIIVVFLVIASLLGQYILTVEKDTTMVRIINQFDLDHESNIPTFFSSILLLASSGLLFLAYSTEMDTSKRKYWLLLSVIFLSLSADEYLSVHEKMIKPMRELLGTSPLYYFAWIIPVIPMLIGLGIYLLRFLRSLPQPIMRLFLLSAALYVSGAIGVELLGGYYVYYNSKDTFSYALIVSLEESLEMIGVILFIYSLLTYLKIAKEGRLNIRIDK